MARRFAIGFKTHVWDAFIERQYQRVRAACRAADLYIIADETHGALAIDHPRVVRSSCAALLRLGLADAYGKGNLLWWNTDYLNYALYHQHADYDYYCFVEYDCRVHLDIDRFLETVAQRRLDLVTLPTRQDKKQWYWTSFHEQVYPYEQIHGSLNCTSVFSARALQYLFDRRVAMAREYEAGRLTFWPGNEIFVATEIRRAGFSVASLEEFGDASGYEWHLPHLEEDVPDDDTRAFLHPVLDRRRYIKSLLKFEFDLSSYFVRGSNLRRSLSRFPARDYVPLMPAAFRTQVMTKLRQGLGRI